MSSAQSTTVLVVDDEPSIRLLCRVNLELEGFTVLEAASVPAARELLAGANGTIDVVLVDVHIAGHDGRDLVRELRRRSEFPRCALVTGSVQLSPDERAGADDVIEKPFSLETLVSTVRRLAERDVDSSTS